MPARLIHDEDGSKSPWQAMKQSHKLKPELFKKRPNHLSGCDK
jgi:hypothetical protein